MHLISIPVRVIIDMSDSENFACKVEIWERQVFDESVCDVDAKSVDSEIDPEAKNVAKLGSNLWVVPVEVGLAVIEQVEIPLAVITATPCRAPKY